MTAPAKEPGTAVQMVESVAIGKLPPEVQTQLELRKLSNQIAGKLAELNWGKALDHATRRAVADWGREYRVDVTTEIHVLGGNIYLNAAYYLRHLAEMIEAGLVEYAFADHVEVDKRLEQLGAEGEGEMTRRLRERLKHRIPDEAASAVVFRVKLRSMVQEITGTKWCGGGTRKSDPVGDQFPVETSESRAARRAMRLLTSHVPKERAVEIERIEESAESLGARVAANAHAMRAHERAFAMEPKPLALPAQGDPYGPVVTVPAPAKEPVEVVVAAATQETTTETKAHAAADPTMADLTASINKLLKHERITEAQRARFTTAAANAYSVGDLHEIIGKIEFAIGDEA